MLIAGLIAQTILWTAFTGALLFLPAGRWDWPQAWAYLAEFAALCLLVGTDIALRDPALFRERSRPTAKGMRPWDVTYVVLLAAGFTAWFAAMGWEARLAPPAWMVWGQALGGAMIASGMGIAWLTMRQNSFAAAAVRLQPDRGQRVIDTGLYARVRHPMYAGAALIMTGIPLMLGSRWGLIGSALIVLLVAIRALGEEKVLATGLPGYADYMRKVRWRLVPGLW